MALFETILISLTLVVLFIASYTDLRTREVPDWLNYSFVFAALGIRTIFSFDGGFNVLLSGILGLVVFYILALLFYYTRQWGGGDSKLLMGMGVVIGITYPFDSSSWNIGLFFFSLLFLGSIYGLFWMVLIAVKKRTLFISQFKESFARRKVVNIVLGSSSLVLLGAGIFLNTLLLLLFFLIAMYYLLLFVVSVEKSCFINTIEIKKLTEGDWLTEDVISDGKVIIKKKTIEKKDIEKLIKDKISHVTIKEGIPFVPSFLFAYLLIVFGSKIFSWLLTFILG